MKINELCKGKVKKSGNLGRKSCKLGGKSEISERKGVKMGKKKGDFGV